jgi:HAL2 family 3'(2'),5'-bisphosphate nucleotidase
MMLIKTMNQPYAREQSVAIAAVREAARLCRAVAAEISPQVLAKKDKSPVTIADFGSQALICTTLSTVFPDDPVMAEEDAAELKQPEGAALLAQIVRHVRAVRNEPSGTSVDFGDDAVCSAINHGGAIDFKERFWTIDPIDGTKGFLRNEQYAVALALIVGGQVVVGALACPNLGAPDGSGDAKGGGDSGGLIFFATKGDGAWVIPSEYPAGVEPQPSRLQVSNRDDSRTARFCESVESGHSAHGDAAAVAAKLGITAPPLRIDSQAKYAAVARGEADIYLRLPTRADYREKIWDHASGALIVAEAGGVVTDIHGRPLEFHHGRELSANRGVVVTNGPQHERVIQAVRALGIGSA